ncbi:MAG: hypothetical protein WBA97_17975 [Actinophytocola sp.]|uniref:hypothetical protein n=1 Tax=Actinophytocola sp. TaxID=1872138 RepID=UPI003C73E210
MAIQAGQVTNLDANPGVAIGSETEGAAFADFGREVELKTEPAMDVIDYDVGRVFAKIWQHGEILVEFAPSGIPAPAYE